MVLQGGADWGSAPSVCRGEQGHGRPADPRGRKGRPGLPLRLPVKRRGGARGNRGIAAASGEPRTPAGSTEPPATAQKTSRPGSGEGGEHRPGFPPPPPQTRGKGG